MRNPRSRAILFGAALVAAGLFGTPPDTGGAAPYALAEDAKAKAGLQFFEKTLDKAQKTIATKLWDIVQDAKKNNFFALAKQEAERTLLYFPDHKEAREYLGFVKKRGKWEIDAGERAKVKDQNSKNVKEAQSSFDKRVEKWKERKAKVDSFIATKIAKVGDQCRAKGFEDQAKKAYRRALSLDKGNKTARTGLGYKKVGKIWLSPEQLAAVKQATTGEWVSEKSELEKGLGIKLNKMQSPHFRVEDDGSKDAMPEAVKQLEVLYAYYLADVGRDPTQDVFEGQQARFCIVSSQPRWEKWVDGFSNAPDKPFLKESNIYVDKKALNAGTLRVETAEHVDTRDPLLHHATHMMNHKVWGLTHIAWLDEGLAYYYTMKVQETTRTHCVQKETEVKDYGELGEEIGGFKDWKTSEFWREYLRQIVAKKDDLEFRTLLNRKLAILELPHTVKSWALITWLMEKRRDEFLAFLASQQDGKEKQEDALERLFGQTIEQLDDEWRKYATRSY